MKQRYVLIYNPVELLISLPEKKAEEPDRQVFNSDNEEDAIRFIFFREDEKKALREKRCKMVRWDSFKDQSPTLASVISEGLLKIGVTA